MANVIITGASKGIGLAFVRHFVNCEANRIFACSRTLSDDLQGLIQSSRSQQVQFVPLDVQSEQSIQSASRTIEQQLTTTSVDDEKEQQSLKINLLINNAGHFVPFEALDNVEYGSFMSSMATNAAGPLFLWKNVRHLLSMDDCKIVQIGSMMGSMDSITYSDGNPSYRCSKAALNMFSILLSNYYGQLRTKELKQRQKQAKMDQNRRHKNTVNSLTDAPIPFNVVSVVLHPGHVQTETGSWSRKKPPLTPDESVRAMMKIIDNVTLEDSGKFFSYDGSILPW